MLGALAFVKASLVILAGHSHSSGVILGLSEVNCHLSHCLASLVPNFRATVTRATRLPHTIKTARLFYHLNMEMMLLHSNPCSIFTDKSHTNSIATVSFFSAII
jgi:hypothetical protein